MTTDLEKLLANATVKPAESMAKQSRAPRNQGTPLDDKVWESYSTETPMDITPVPESEGLTIKRTLEKSARYLTREEGVEVKVSVQIIPIGRNKVTVRFMAREPYMTGARKYRAQGTVPKRRK